jgi:hypothetical protein
LLGECLNKNPENRPSNLKVVMDRLTQGADPRQSHSGGAPPSVVLVEQSVPVIQPVIPVVQPSVAHVEPSVPVARVLHDVIPVKEERRSPSGLRNGEVRKMVHPAGVALLIVGILGAGLDFLVAIFVLAGGSASTSGSEPAAVFYFTAGVAAVVAILGGIAMMNMRNYTLAFIGSIAAMYGACVCLLSGVGIGIWCVIVLSKAEVRDAFQ